MDDFIWTTRQNKKLKMHEISDRHFMNIIEMKTRNALMQETKQPDFPSSLSAATFLQGEHALDTITDDYDDRAYDYWTWQEIIRHSVVCRAFRNELHDNRSDLLVELNTRLKYIDDDAPAAWGIEKPIDLF